MKIALPLLLAIVAIACMNGSSAQETTPTPPADATIQWLTWDEAMLKMKAEPKKIFIDLYTDWCGWCKRMDATTFTDPKVIASMNAHFYAVKFNAEQTADVVYDNHTFKYHGEVGRRGVHELAYALLDGQMSYPSFVYLDAQRQRISISPGYKDADMMDVELRFIGGDHFLTQTFEAFKATQN